MVSVLQEALQRRLEVQPQESLGRTLAGEFLSLENVAYLMAHGETEKNGLLIGPHQLIYRELAVAVGDENIALPTLTLYKPEIDTNALIPFIQCNFLTTPEGIMELAHIVCYESALTDALQTLPRLKKENKESSITYIDIDIQRDTVVYRARLLIPPRPIIPITGIDGVTMKAYAEAFVITLGDAGKKQRNKETRVVSVVTLNMDTDEWVERTTRTRLFGREQTQEKASGVYGLGDESYPGILRRVITEFLPAEQTLLQEEGRRQSTLIPRFSSRRKNLHAYP